MTSAQDKYKKELSKFLGDQHVEMYWKGRVGLYALLKSLGVGEGDEVIVPAFTCVVVPSAVLYLGARPVYVDVERGSFSPSSRSISEAVSSSTKVIICQNTFGLSYELDKIVELARANGIYTLEDCTHGFGGTYNGRPNGTFCDAAFYSTQWNKPFSTGIGGFVSVGDTKLVRSLKEVTALAEAPGSAEQAQLLVLFFARFILINRYTYWFMMRLYRTLSKNNYVVGSSSPDELEGTVQPQGYFKAGGSIQAILGNRSLKSMESSLVRRRKNGGLFSDKLSSMGKNHVEPIYFDNHSFLTYPLLVRDKSEFVELAEKSKIMLGDWFSSPLHPISESLERWDFQSDLFPTAKFCSEHIVNLPTYIKDPARIVEFLEDHSDLIIDE